MYVESVPQVATDDDTTESQILNSLDGVEVHTSQRIHLFIYKPLFGGLSQLVHRKRSLLVGIGLTVEDGVQEDVVGVFLCFFQLVYLVAGARHVSFVSRRWFGTGVVYMNALQAVFLF